ncbi:MAG: hypothetical protein ACLSB9_21490 [Hydrogeniiclostridium mannosilyticum]
MKLGRWWRGWKRWRHDYPRRWDGWGMVVTPLRTMAIIVVGYKGL